MNRPFSLVIGMILVYCPLLVVAQQSAPPQAPVKTVTDTYHGVEIEDPYRYMEDLKNPEVLEWFKKQTMYTNAEFGKLKGKDKLIALQKVVDNMQTAKITQLKITDNDKHFYLKRTPDDNTAKLYYRKNFEGEEVLLFSPGEFKPDSGIEYVINYIQPDWEGNQIAISLTKKGQEVSEIIVLNVDTKKRGHHTIDHCWPSDLGGVNWLPDNSGFVYIHLPVIDAKSDDFLKKTTSVLYKIGDNPKELREVFSAKSVSPEEVKPEDFPALSLRNRDDKYLIGRLAGVSAYQSTYYAPLPKNGDLSNLKWTLLFKAGDRIRNVVVVGDSLIYKTAKNTPNFQICKTSIQNPDFDNPKILVKQRKDAVITDFEVTSEGLFYTTNKNGIEAALYEFKNGKETLVELPEVSGNLSIKSKGVNYPNLWVTTKGWTSKGNRYKYDSALKTFIKADLVERSSLPGLEDFVIEELTVKSHDGEEVPLSLIYKKGMKKHGKNRVLFYGYGSYGYSLKPSMYTNLYLWVAEGGIFAIPHVRGGGEKGDAWYKAGFKTTKPNTWKDLIACTEYMIDEGYTSNKHTAIWSASAGGILIGRAMTERPDLFAAAIIQVGVMNLIRQETQPNGPNNVKEYGTVKDPEEFKALLEMDAYHHIKDGVHYPATYITAGMNDPRVSVWDPAKFAARLQTANASNNPIFFSVDFESGHGAGDTKAKQFESLADIVAFALWRTGHKDYEYRKN
ncbi:prolyl oligopeptidase family serine peptidase [Sinomicrobium sp. M5D2P9]